MKSFNYLCTKVINSGKSSKTLIKAVVCPQCLSLMILSIKRKTMIKCSSCGHKFEVKNEND